jgi:hypothetical protein
MGSHRYERHVRRRTVGFVAFALALIAVLGTVPAVADAASPPSVFGESVTTITEHDATLEAEINTEGFESTYEFHLQEAPLCFKANPPCERPQHEPLTLPSGKLLGSSVGQSVSANLNSAGVSLSPGEHYEYWVTATNVAGTITGPAQDFTAPKRPTSSIEYEWATNVTSTDATLNATIDPHGLYTAYEFQIYTSATYDYPRSECPLPPDPGQCNTLWSGEPLPAGLLEPPPASIPAGSPTQSVNVDLASIGATLQPGTTYHFRVIVANYSDFPEVYGPDRTFTTPEDGVQPVNTTITPSGGGSSSGSGSRAPGSSASQPTTSTGTSSKPPSVEPSSSKHHVKHQHHSQSRTLVTYTAEGGLFFRYTSLIVSARGQSTVTFNSCVVRFRLDAALWKRLKTALKQTNLHALAGDYPPPLGAADEITEVITVGHDTVRITDFASIPEKVRQELEPLVKIVRETVTVGERRMPPSCSSKRTSGSMG